MPQMSPLSWCLLSLSFGFLFLCIFVKNSWYQSPLFVWVKGAFNRGRMMSQARSQIKK